MDIQTLVVGQLQTNCYLINDPITDNCVIIDPGAEATLISQKIVEQTLNPIAIIATHGHFDHVLGAKEIQLNFKIPFLLHAKDKKILSNARQSAQYWLKQEILFSPPQINQAISQKSKIQFGNQLLEVLHSPGHTPGGIVLFNTEKRLAFVGDTIFKNGVGRTDFKYASAKQLHRSIKKIERKLKGYTAYPGHGEKFII